MWLFRAWLQFFFKQTEMGKSVYVGIYQPACLIYRLYGALGKLYGANTNILCASIVEKGLDVESFMEERREAAHTSCMEHWRMIWSGTKRPSYIFLGDKGELVLCWACATQRESLQCCHNVTLLLLISSYPKMRLGEYMGQLRSIPTCESRAVSLPLKPTDTQHLAP